MSDPMALTTSQQFEIERMNRTIDATTDVADLRRIAKMLLQAWQTQRAASVWAMRQTLPRRQNAPAAEATRAPVPPNQNSSS